MQSQEPIPLVFDDQFHSNQMESLNFLPNGINEFLMFQLLEFQKLLNIELLKNQEYINCYLPVKKESNGSRNGQSGTSSTSDGVDNMNAHHGSHRTIINIRCKAIRLRSPTHSDRREPCKRPSVKNHISFAAKDSDYDSSYDPNNEKPPSARTKVNSESKNVPKNISKAILIFVMKKQASIRNILEQMHINKEQFMEAVANLKGKINAISQLRSLWLDSQNKHAKIFRIISNYYLRKYSLSHIFNSRVIEHAKHLKYRQRILQALTHPEYFTHMKDY